MIEACPTCLGYVFSEIQATVEYYTNIFDPDDKKLLGLSFSLDPVIQADMAIKTILQLLKKFLSVGNR